MISATGSARAPTAAVNVEPIVSATAPSTATTVTSSDLTNPRMDDSNPPTAPPDQAGTIRYPD
ncbi:hypothetical protein NIIDNTM18_12680 [Mycolicibacterium litorale]|uniref:Uncharacterized protein n=1 Tax=Mycolicibacterium litorale TaxID=758802 RepID=A0A6S6P5N2_9MYCO|nr:hypothetical protein NIIDNTM18_12680 [Mycolicibacterium litorale]